VSCCNQKKLIKTGMWDNRPTRNLTQIPCYLELNLYLFKYPSIWKSVFSEPPNNCEWDDGQDGTYYHSFLANPYNSITIYHGLETREHGDKVSLYKNETKNSTKESLSSCNSHLCIGEYFSIRQLLKWSQMILYIDIHILIKSFPLSFQCGLLPLSATGLSDLFLRNSIWQNWWYFSCRLVYKRLWYLSYWHSLSPLLCHFREARGCVVSCPMEKPCGWKPPRNWYPSSNNPEKKKNNPNIPVSELRGRSFPS
jgi:hypothetical protein